MSGLLPTATVMFMSGGVCDGQSGAPLGLATQTRPLPLLQCPYSLVQSGVAVRCTVLYVFSIEEKLVKS
jgi:hypothetical protein